MIKQELETYKKITHYDLEQLELDYLQNIMLKIIYSKFTKIYFKGGTCLQKCYGIKRFSEDLDFNHQEKNVHEIITYIKNYFPYEFSIKEHKQTAFGDTFILKIKGILYSGHIQSTCKLILDFRKGDIHKKGNVKKITPLYKDIPRYQIVMLDITEIFAEKIRAIMTRFKARDIFDLYQLAQMNVNTDIELINKKLETYNKTFTLAELEEKIEEKRSIYEEEISLLTQEYPSFETCKENILRYVQE